jgi:phosphotransferase system HPr (HPr) family protein
MIVKNYVIMDPEGIHARPATALVRLVKKFKSAISLKKDEKVIRLNSMINILSMGAKGGETISIMIEGQDEVSAGEAIDLFFTEQLGNL